MYRVTGQRSAGLLDRAGRHVFLDYMKDQGFTAKPEKKAGSAANKIIAGLEDVMAGRVTTTVMDPDVYPFEAVKAGLEVKPGEKPQVVLIDALWADLAARGAFKYGIHASLPTFMTKLRIHVAHPNFCTPAQCNKIIEALKAWLRRHAGEQGGKP